MEEIDPEDEKFFDKLQAADLKAIDKAMNRLIDTVSKFKSVDTLEELKPEDFIDMLYSLEHSHFVVSGVMYTYGMNVYEEDCEHDHDDEDE
jgi:hypothetical protein